MPISTTCPACGQRLKAKDTLAGKQVPCPGCGGSLRIPQPGEGPLAYALQSEAPAATPRPAVSATPPPVAEPERPARMVETRRPPASLPPLKADETPLWLRHMHWLLVLALVPLAFSLLHERSDEDDFKGRLIETLKNAPPDVQVRVLHLLEKSEVSDDELFAILPDQKMAGALLPHKTLIHWGFAAVAAVLFLAFFLLLASGGAASPTHLLVTGLFTATVGIVLLLLFQTVADWSQGVWIRGSGIAVLLFYIVKFIGFSYRAAMDADNGFVLSFLGYTCGVGFCEEVCKSLPLLWASRRSSGQSWRGLFLWGLASGAGFGIAEGVMYSANFYNGIHGPSIYLVRFISCVALHALWTGSVAITLHLNRDLLDGADTWYEYAFGLLRIVAVPMLLHGLYDTLLKKEMNAFALGVAVLSFLYLAFLISRLHGEDDATANEEMLREYQRRRAGLS